MKSIKLWKSKYDEATATASLIEVECPNGRWPAVDADGETVFDNSHFNTREEAFAHRLHDAECVARFRAGQINELRQRLRDGEKRAADAVVYLAAVEDLRVREFPAVRDA